MLDSVALWQRARRYTPRLLTEGSVKANVVAR